MNRDINHILEAPPATVVAEDLSVEELLHEASRIIPVARQNLLTKVSHGIRTPMMAILGFEGILRDGRELPGGKRQEFELLAQEARENLAQYMTCLRTFEEMRTNRFSMNRTLAKISETVESVELTFRHRSRVRGVALELVVRGNGALIFADHDRLRLALEMLIANAIHATPASGTVRVTLKSITRGISIAVEDTGRGIRREHLSDIFRPFSRLDSPNDSGAELGLGLTVARSIVELHGGTISVASIPSRGSRFRILLPF